MTALPLFETTRGGIVESIHYGSIAVVDANGKLISSYGDPQTVAFLRSSAKPFQALPFVERGGGVGGRCLGAEGTDGDDQGQADVADSMEHHRGSLVDSFGIPVCRALKVRPGAGRVECVVA